MNHLVQSSRKQILTRAAAAVSQSPVITVVSSCDTKSYHSASEPGFVYRGWHVYKQPPRSNSYKNLYHTNNAVHQVDDDTSPQPELNVKIMSPKHTDDDTSGAVSWDEDYDEFNLHSSPHQVSTRCTRISSLEDLDPNEVVSNQATDISDDYYDWRVPDPTTQGLYLYDDDEYIVEHDIAFDHN